MKNLLEGSVVDLEPFLDALYDAGAFELQKGQEINNYGIGGVDIKCLEASIVEDSEHGKIKNMKLNLCFQADASPILQVSFTLCYEDEDEEEPVFEFWVSIQYTDEEGNDDPGNSDYFDEFVYDLSPVE